MTPEQADKRIIKSRQALHRYRAMIAAGERPEADIDLWQNEIGELGNIAMHHHGKAEKIARLVNDWRDLIGQMRTVH